MSQQDYERLYSAINNANSKIDRLAETTGVIKTNAEGTRRAVEFQNGRVTKNEKKIEDIYRLFNRLLMTIVGFMVVTIISLLVYIYQTDRSSEELVKAFQATPITAEIDPESLQKALSGMEMEMVE